MLAHRLQHFEQALESRRDHARVAGPELFGGAGRAGDADAALQHMEVLVLAGGEVDVPGAGFAAPEAAGEFACGIRVEVDGGAPRVAAHEPLRFREVYFRLAGGGAEVEYAVDHG